MTERPPAITGYHPIEDVVDARLAPSVDWLMRQLRSGQVGGCRVGNKWFMSDEDITAMMEAGRIFPSRMDHAGFTAGTSRRAM